MKEVGKEGRKEQTLIGSKREPNVFEFSLHVVS